MATPHRVRRVVPIKVAPFKGVFRELTYRMIYRAEPSEVICRVRVSSEASKARTFVVICKVLGFNRGLAQLIFKVVYRAPIYNRA